MEGLRSLSPVLPALGEEVPKADCSPRHGSRFLRARKFDLPKAKIMWIDTQKWKKSFKVDELYETFNYTEKDQVNTLYPRLVCSSSSSTPQR